MWASYCSSLAEVVHASKKLEFEPPRAPDLTPQRDRPPETHRDRWSFSEESLAIPIHVADGRALQ